MPDGVGRAPGVLCGTAIPGCAFFLYPDGPELVVIPELAKGNPYHPEVICSAAVLTEQPAHSLGNKTVHQMCGKFRALLSGAAFYWAGRQSKRRHRHSVRAQVQTCAQEHSSARTDRRQPLRQ